VSAPRPPFGVGQRNAPAGGFRAWVKAGIIRRRGKTITVADLGNAPSKRTAVNPSPRFTTVVDMAAYVAAGVAGVFSIRGMVVLFPGAPLTIVTMAIAMESAKLATAGWLAARRRSPPGFGAVSWSPWSAARR
jgi:hypothetical protein